MDLVRIGGLGMINRVKGYGGKWWDGRWACEIRIVAGVLDRK